MISILISLALIFSQLSLLAFGGGNTILPEMQRQVVQVHQWMSAADFSALFALGQAAPGPNLMVVTLVGWHVAGWMGVVVTTIAKFGPSSLLTVGLMASSAALITYASVHSWILGAITGATALIASTCLHLFLSTSYSDGVDKAGKKAQLVMALYFIAANIHYSFPKAFPKITFSFVQEKVKEKKQ